mmetsp:Transcript_5888/g.10613  ORF Transcript_5888/g.10613 Transcript_5888/m.10613 type:complete len:216 (-) Transcript_5888:90-737(-)
MMNTETTGCCELPHIATWKMYAALQPQGGSQHKHTLIPQQQHMVAGSDLSEPANRSFFDTPYTYFSGISISPAAMSSLTSLGLRPSTLHPVLKALPRISLTVPFNSRAKDRGRMMRAMLMISSKGMLPVCLMCLTFFLSRGGSFKARMTKEVDEGTSSADACLFLMDSLTVTRRPFQSLLHFMMSSPTFLAFRPKGPTLGAKVEVAPISPPTART